MTSLVPRPPYSDAELAALYPPSLHLQQVQILLRHGERTPVSARFANAGLAAYWPYCSAVSRFRSAVLTPSSGTETPVSSSPPSPSSPSSTSSSSSSSSSSSPSFSDLQWRRRLESFGPNDAAVPATGPDGSLDNLCDLGMLTDRGRETTHALGVRLRRLYVDRLGFLPASIKDASDFMYLRATPIPRALESMQQAFLGLYPPHTRDADFPPLTILSRYSPEETLFPNDMHCRRFAELSRAFAQRAADRWNDSDEMRYLTSKLGKYMPDENNPRVAVDSKPRLSGIMDTVNSTLAHGPPTRLPRDFYDPKARRIIEKVSVDEWFAGYGESREYRALGIGALLGDVVARMVVSAERDVPPPDTEFVRPPGQQRRSGGAKASSESDEAAIRFGLSGCHDTTLAAILASLGAYNTEAWPPFTSHIAIELFRSSDKPPSSSTPFSSTASSSSSSSWWPSFLSPKSQKQPPSAIYRKPTPALTPAERQALDGYYVRLRYNDQPVTVPGCKGQGNHFPGDESFCTLAAFKSIVDKFTPKDWQAECRANIKKAAFPDVKEPAGY